METLVAPPTSRTGEATILEVLLRHAASTPDRVAFRFLAGGDVESDSVTFGQLADQTRALALSLHASEEMGACVLLLLDSGLAFIKAMFACMYAGLVPVAVDLPRPNRPTDRLEAIVRHSGCRALITSKADLPRVEKLIVAVPALAALECHLVDTATAGPIAGTALPRPAAGHAAFIQYTSGSTSTPRGVVVTHGNLMSNQVQIKSAFEHDEHTKFCGWLPMFHDMGLIGNVLHPLYLGIECTLMPPAAFVQRPLRWLDAISRYGATTAGGPNFAYDHCVSRIAEAEIDRLDLSGWRAAFSGAEAVRASTLREFARKFARAGFDPTAFLPCYGLAEATLLAAGHSRFGRAEPVVLRVDRAQLEQGRLRCADPAAGAAAGVELVSNGPPAPDQTIFIVDPATVQPCAAGEIGEIWLAGPNVSARYAHDAERTQSVLHARLPGCEQRFVATGDLGTLWSGELLVVGRRKNLIIVRGRKIHAEDLEHLVGRSHELFQRNRCAAFAVQADAAGEESVVIVQEAVRRPRSEAEVRQALAGALDLIAEHFDLVPLDMVLVLPGTIPVTTSGKIRHAPLRRAYLAGEIMPAPVREGSAG
ncbi:fatty acyl-AMP ligase [Ramlibacter tataouinensis]|uniref:Acyl-CoA ligase (Acyl-CoA synthetase)-like protein n=1 Tax=Ramlibacter tataouinensis (strain ATCC BAA-407 / DSM 14655 / LMG 21543 / TTB310) TaxID=365046 RepID=F5XVI6_RAMTT|nr:fatty acyl-AMP ligase [Ramlibacter tataouinensis]AEG91562.1 acyl-CoA ligase (acyl-CoA synthetase)-like protein [Ramlibacter tataouinensis TTB310]